LHDRTFSPDGASGPNADSAGQDFDERNAGPNNTIFACDGHDDFGHAMSLSFRGKSSREPGHEQQSDRRPEAQQSLPTSVQFAQRQRGIHRIPAHGFDQDREKRSAKAGQNSNEDCKNDSERESVALL
jgi:hypothetical protein